MAWYLVHLHHQKEIRVTEQPSDSPQTPYLPAVRKNIDVTQAKCTEISAWGGAGREKAKILNGHIFFNTYQNCTKFSVVVYCVDI